MKKLVVALFLFQVLTTIALAQNENALIAKFNTITFELSKSKRDIPKSFIKYYNEMQRRSYGNLKSKRFVIADVGEVFNPSDFGGKIPDRRLIFQSRKRVDNLYFIYFEKGGAVANQRYLYILEYIGGRPQSFLALTIYDNSETYEGLKDALKNNQFRIMK